MNTIDVRCARSATYFVILTTRLPSSLSADEPPNGLDSCSTSLLRPHLLSALPRFALAEPTHPQGRISLCTFSYTGISMLLDVRCSEFSENFLLCRGFVFIYRLYTLFQPWDREREETALSGAWCRLGKCWSMSFLFWVAVNSYRMWAAELRPLPDF